MTEYIAKIPETAITDEIDIGVKSNCYVLAQDDDIIYLDPDMVDTLINELHGLPLPEIP